VARHESVQTRREPIHGKANGAADRQHVGAFGPENFASPRRQPLERILNLGQKRLPGLGQL
jgi:hypothetical protein